MQRRFHPKRLLFSYLNPVISLAFRKGIDDVEQTPVVPKSENTRQIAKQLKMCLEENYPAKSIRSSLIRGMFHVVKWNMLFAALLQVVFCVCQIMTPLMLIELIKSLQDPNSSNGWIYAVVLACCQIVGGFANQHQLDIAFRCGIELRAALSVLVFEYMLKLKLKDSHKHDAGKIINLVSSDTNKFFELFPLLNLVWAAPIMIFVTLGLLIDLLGWAAPIGVFFLCLMVPVNAALAMHLAHIRKKHLKQSDARVKISSEVMSGMRVVKMNSWETRFLTTILGLRDKELRYVSKELHTFADFIGILICFPIISVGVAFSAYVLLNPDEGLQASTAFGTLSLFSLLRFPLMMLGQTLNNLAQAKVSLNRISSFLEKVHEIDNDDDDGGGGVEMTPTSSTVIALKNASYAWREEGEEKEEIIKTIEDEEKGSSETSKHFSLSRIDLVVKRKELVAVIGRVGSGKSTLLRGLLGELYEQNDVRPRGVLCYTPQTPWITNASVRENILLTSSESANEEVYRKVLAGCGLLVDMDQLSDGDRTVIGERGVTLSGGQKARLSLARAAYHALVVGRENAIVVMDDVLSSLDVHTAKKVFDEVIVRLLANTTRILVTHATHYVSQCDSIAMVHHNTCTNIGNFSTLKQKTYREKLSKKLNHDQIVEVEREIESLIRTNQEESSKESEDEDKMNHENETKQDNNSIDTSAALIAKEEVFADRLSWGTVRHYFKALGGLKFALSLGTTLLTERCFYVGTDVWLAAWTSASNGTTPEINSNLPVVNDRDDTRFYLGIYMAFAFISAVLAFARVHVFASGCVFAAKNLFEQLITNLVFTPMSFFETTPLGRITNRISYDTEVIDSMLLQRVNGVIASTAWLLGGVFVMCATIPFLTLILIPVLVVYIMLYRYYRKSCVDLQLLDSVTRSPIQIHLLETQVGGESVRSFSLTQMYQERFLRHIRINNRAVRTLIGSNRWLSLRLDLLGGVVVFSAAFLAFVLDLDGSLAGLCVLWSINMTMSLNFSTINLTESESKLTSVQRVVKYSDVEQESGRRDDDENDRFPTSKADITPENVKTKKKNVFPKDGRVVFEQAVMSYRDELPPALKGLSVSINSGEKVGIVGRTGAGKSTIAVALFRLRPLMSGRIVVGGQDISSLTYEELRGQGVCVISQQPVLFTGALRKALDPFDSYEDRDIWNALEMLQMKPCILRMAEIDERKTKTLSTDEIRKALAIDVEEGGRNFSVGERQLLCFARAVLRKPKVLVLDEATASCDMKTDAVIRRSIRSNFKNSTLLIIAHRLESIMDCDKILTMSDGKCVEFASPKELLKKPKSVFSALVDGAGEKSAQVLREIAEHGFEQLYVK